MRVLIVENNSAIRQICSLNLSGRGFQLLFASSLEETLTTLDSETEIDAVLLDLNLPDVLAELKQAPWLNHVPVILVTVCQDE